MQHHSCPYCIITSNRKYNIIRHIHRKHSGNEIPDNLFAHSKSGLYACPYCSSTSNRKYNMKEHIHRKHPVNKIPDNMKSTNKYFTRPYSFLGTPSITFHSPVKHPNYIQNLPPLTLNTDSRKETRHNSIFKTMWEFLAYKNFLQNQSLSQFPYFYQNNNVFDLYSPNIFYEPLSNIDFGNPFLFKVYKCSVCFRDTPFMCSAFESIKTNSEYMCCINLNLLPRKIDKYKNMIDPKIKEFSINKIFSLIDKKRDTKPKLCLKSIKIPLDFYQQLNFDQNQFDPNEKGNENSINNVPSWLQKFLLHETFFGLEHTDENNWALRLTSSNDNSTIITREELIQFINLSNSTFGLFKFQKDQFNIYHFFAYLQLEK
jgi:hypothetical protein